MTGEEAKAQQTLLMEDIRHLQRRLRKPQDTIEEGVRLQGLLDARRAFYWTLQDIVDSDESESAAA